MHVFNLDHYCHEGPMARSVTDVALLENVIAGPHWSDVASVRPKLEIPEALDGVGGLRIALSVTLGGFVVDDEVAANTRAAADRLREAGAVVEEVELPWDPDVIGRAVRIHFGMIFAPSIRELYTQAGDQLTTYARYFYEESERIVKDDLVEGLELEGQIYAPLGRILEDFDALICPTFAVPALPAEWDASTDEVVVNGEALDDWVGSMMTVPFNIASRCPVLSVPSGRAASGVPTGLSVVGRTYDDVTAFRVARAHERLFPTYDTAERRPQF
jgi:aspartyl-tRNA(Asn)/glutamyl-tRNA(Gln) amidotransferase subunit A